MVEKSIHVLQHCSYIFSSSYRSKWCSFFLCYGFFFMLLGGEGTVASVGGGGGGVALVVWWSPWWQIQLVYWLLDPPNGIVARKKRITGFKVLSSAKGGAVCFPNFCFSAFGTAEMCPLSPKMQSLLNPLEMALTLFTLPSSSERGQERGES